MTWGAQQNTAFLTNDWNKPLLKILSIVLSNDLKETASDHARITEGVTTTTCRVNIVQQAMTTRDAKHTKYPHTTPTSNNGLFNELKKYLSSLHSEVSTNITDYRMHYYRGTL